MSLSDGRSAVGELVWQQAGRRRRLVIGPPAPLAVGGLVELMDNNPLVCADEASVPDPAATLGLIALGPLIRAGLMVEPPVLQFSFEVDFQPLAAEIAAWGWDGEIIATAEAQELGDVLSLNALVEIDTPADWNAIDDLFHESYGRSFFVRESAGGDWDTQLVAGKPWAVYRLRITPDEPRSLLTIQVMADRDGKCGSAQAIHAFNVMAGFEESLGLEE